MAYVGMTLGLCPPLGTVIGGQIHVALGWQFNFVLVAALGAVLFVAAWFGLPRPAGAAARPAPAPGAAAAPASVLGQVGRAYGQLLRRPDYLLHVGVLGCTTAAFYMFLAGAPLVLRSYGIGPGQVGFFIMVVPMAYIVGNFLTSRLVHRQGGSVLMRAGQALTLGGTALMLGLGLAGVHTPLAFVLPLLLLGLGHGMLVPPCLVAMVALVPTVAGAASALAGVTQQFAGALGGYLVGWVPHHSHSGVAALMLGATVLASVARGAVRRRGASTTS
jgi:DHA1 family bicyclomycin/chloramphenicol resistance-like MFS transporter